MSLRPWTDDELLGAPARFAHARVARFQDVDAAGIVFFPRIVEYLHDAYVELLAAGGSPLDQVLANKSWAAPIRDVQTRFLKPIHFGDRLEVCIVLSACEGADLRLGFRVRAPNGGLTHAIGQTSHVFVDPTTFQRTDAPEAVQRLLTRFEGA